MQSITAQVVTCLQSLLETTGPDGGPDVVFKVDEFIFEGGEPSDQARDAMYDANTLLRRHGRALIDALNARYGYDY